MLFFVLFGTSIVLGVLIIMALTSDGEGDLLGFFAAGLIIASCTLLLGDKMSDEAFQNFRDKALQEQYTDYNVLTTTGTYSGTIEYVDDGEYCSGVYVTQGSEKDMAVTIVEELTTCGKEER